MFSGRLRPRSDRLSVACCHIRLLETYGFVFVGFLSGAFSGAELRNQQAFDPYTQERRRYDDATG